MRRIIVEWGRPQMATWRVRIACWTSKATNTHSEYVILIAFPQQQWLQESASVLLYTYIASFVIKKKNKQNTVNDSKHYAFVNLLQHILAVYVGHYQVESQHHK